MIKVSKDTFQKMKERGMIYNGDGKERNYGVSKNNVYVQDNVMRNFLRNKQIKNKI